MYRLFVLLLFASLAAGCGGRSQSEIDRGKAAVTAALDAWKENRPADHLKQLPEPVTFTEDLRESHTLTSYELGAINADDPEVIRYTVKLSLRDRKGKVSEREVVYAVALKSPVVVARDPYY